MKPRAFAASLFLSALLCPLALAEEKTVTSGAPEPAPELRLAATDLADLVAAQGKRVVVTGTVIRTNHSQSGMNFLNFVDEIRTGFVVVIKGADVPKFGDIPPQYLYLKKKIQITGTIAMYRAQPQIVVHSPKQIKILSDPEP